MFGGLWIWEPPRWSLGSLSQKNVIIWNDPKKRFWFSAAALNVMESQNTFPYSYRHSPSRLLHRRNWRQSRYCDTSGIHLPTVLHPCWSHVRRSARELHLYCTSNWEVPHCTAAGYQWSAHTLWSTSVRIWLVLLIHLFRNMILISFSKMFM